MVFKRRTRKSSLRALAEFFYPRGGWRRSTAYVMHRLRRLPDTPHRICVGIAAGTFVSFLPLWGLHFLLAALVAWVFRGNILAALLGTFFGNPITFPIIAVTSLELGSWLIGGSGSMKFAEVMAAMGYATTELSANLFALFTSAPLQWEKTSVFLWRVFLPFILGGTILGIPTAIAMYYLCLPLVQAYQRRRLKRLKARFEAARQIQRERETGDEP
ncbi:MAG: DUF2062 domain-containing protein [Pararhodobacter sp.]|nr:DUF2062 domain-containing protein [Pararhodobacter sp.]